MPRHRPQDHFGRRAREQGFPARSIYKLEEIDKRLRLLRPGQRVLDLGAAPGSWSLYAAQRVGAQGRVLGVDRNAITVGAPPQLSFMQLDLETAEPDALGAPGSFDVVLSDMAPQTSGQRHRDQFLSFELYMRGLHFAAALLAPGGFYVGKIFQGPELQQARDATTRLLGQTRIFKPEASRRESYEIFLAGGGAGRQR
jgi:23S rRNA (uridine2552-2'-O)-methyltransferase